MKKNPVIRLFLFSILIVSHHAPAAFAAMYYVDSNGNDANDGRSLKTPFQTIQKAASTVKPGDTIEIRGGTYQGSLISNPGAENAWIVMKPHDNERVVIQGRFAGNPTIYFYHRSCDEKTPHNYPCTPLYWELKGLEIHGYGAGGGDDNAVKIDTPRVRLTGNNLSGSSADVVKLVRTADDVEILNNEIHRPNAANGDNAQGIDIVGADRTRIAGNYVHDIPSIGMYAKGNSRDTVFENNRVENTFSHGIMLGQSTDEERLTDGRYETYDGVIRNNIIFNTGWSCLATSSSYNAKIYNNSCYNTGANTHGSILISNESEVGQAGTRIEIKNNIIYGSSNRPMIKITSRALTDDTTLDINHNLYWTRQGASTVTFIWQDRGLYNASFAKWQSVTKQDTKSRVADPRYMSATDIRLKAGSPAIDAGINTDLVTSDYQGASRPYNHIVDIGAYEFRPDAR